jgi:hypothetical protein
LRAALDYIEASPLADLQKNPSYLVSLTANEREQEAELTREVTQLYDSFKSRNPLTETFNPMAGGFDKTWTHVGGQGQTSKKWIRWFATPKSLNATLTSQT